ncbi:C2 domain containing protein [Neofusicoccum parvum]|nr:C2 domain containing protein [Neofusicoccum parvum]
MADQQQHMPGGHYSGANPVPTVRKFIENLDKDKKERDKQLEEQAKNHQQQPGDGSGSGVTAHKQHPLGIKGTQKEVTDPTTGRQVVIEDVKKEVIDSVDNPKARPPPPPTSPQCTGSDNWQLSVPNANLGKDTPIKTDASQSNPEYKYNQDVTAPPDPVEEGTTSDVPIHGEKTNILFHPTPSVSYEPYFEAMEKRTMGLCGGIFAAIIVIGRIFGGRLFGLIPLGFCVASGVWLWMKEVVRSGREVEWDSEQTRGQTATANLLPESVEWMNTFLGIVWGLINPDMFQGIADTLEDVMQASVPGVIENVRVAEINQGSNPLRILSLRALPDTHMKEMKDAIHEENKKTKDPQEAAADEEGGDFYNLECSFAYHAKPSGKRASDKARNMHMQLVFYLGIKGLFGVPLPIFVELQGLVGTIRLRMNLTPEPPFLKTLTFTLMGVPQVQAGCIPMIEKGVNILNLPLISNFVNYAIGAAASMYVAPKSMSIDMRAILQGDDIQKDVQALGVLWIRIHRAVGLSKQDKRGSKHGGSDPYITLSFSKYGKPMYCTRVITDDLNPIWEETTALLVTPELIKADENLSVELWDSDRHSADDIVGKVELSMQKMIQHPGKMYPQVSKLAGMDADSTMPGELHWEVGYFGKPKYRPELRTDGKNKALPDELKDHPELQDEKGVTNTNEDDAVQHTPPDPLWPSGVCSIIVHQIVNLELENVKGTTGSRNGREFEPAKPYGETTEQEGKNLPTSYCTILYNDELVYRTRAKAVSSQPIFNAGTERFMRDWRSGIVTVAVRDSRNREHDPILGIVPLKISDILETSSQVTRWYPLDGGIGFGRIRISLLWRSIETRLPPNLLGWDVGTFEFTSERILAVNYNHHAKLRLRTGGSTAKIPRTEARPLDEGDGMYWDLAKKEGKNDVRLPVKYRYRSPIVFEFHLSGKRKANAYAVIWLHHFIDNEETPVNIPIWTCSSPARLTQNYITEDNCKGEVGLEDLQEVGRLQFSARFKAGTDESHEAFIMDNDSRETYETWEACMAEGVRQRRVDKELPDRIQQLHEASLTSGRDILQDAPEEEKQKWLTRDGNDWSGAFGDDPKAYMDASGRKRREPGRDAPLHDPHHPSSDEDHESDLDNDDSNSSDDLGIQDADTMNGSTTDGRKSTSAETANTTTTATTSTSAGTQDSNGSASSSKDANRQNKRTEARKQRGLMQWKPARNAKFAKDEGIIGLRRLKNRVTGKMEGRKPGVETETGT